ncbi:hypothetical protein BDZ94DRAFT_1264751 [Collybia nuda]|uniref:Ankyrin repeat protein n=1 Tax=Collybia nuda TaxID=64659 RepID=A0A9P5Y267_9AGAR|nr:hypothetical protein BDZ94DRAFT_1264751 [Collybia nuda]
MQQTPEAEAFLKRIVPLPTGPGISLDDALQPSLDDEAELRKLFATDKANARLNDPFVGLVDVFAAPADIRTTRARVVVDDEDLSRKYVMPLSTNNRRQEGAPCIVNDLEEFKKNWSVFSEGSLSQLFDWSNLVAAGGAVLACLTPLSDTAKESKRAMRKYYHSAAYPTSDVDLFLWGMDTAQAEKKINAIYEAVRDSVPWDVTCVRTKHTISIHSQYPYRSVQIVLRLYQSPAEIMAGFDIDAPCCFYNGERVYANPRAIVAMMRQCNTVDMTRRSPSYEVRLAKYSGRGFEVYVPTLERGNIDPTIYERSIARIEGLARLLVLEKLTNTDVRYAFLESRRTLRGRPNPLNQYRRRKRKHNGDLKADTAIGGLEMNDYDVATLHIPYGPGWDARRIDKLVYQTDLGMNSTFNPKNKGRRLHRHPAFFGTMAECVEDCCEHCPAPIDADERQLQEDEDKQYIRGRVAFIEEDPGRQSMSGSFNPIDVGEWSEQVYIGETEHFFAAIAAHDSEGVSRLLEKGADVHRRDHVGRTPLHVAILCKASDIACLLIDAGARMMARLVDGRSCLHLAAQLDQASVVRKLLERSVVNQEQASAGKPDDKDDVEMNEPGAPERLSSEDDWSSEEDDMAMDSGDEGDDDGEGDDDEDKPKKDDKAATGPAEDTQDHENFLEEDDEPDILDVNLPDWDLGFTPLVHAVMSGSLQVVEILLAGGADPKLITTNRGTGFHPLALTVLRKDEDEASQILERLILAGASTSTADDQMRTIFHRILVEDKLKLVSTILQCDPNAKAVLDFPSFVWQNAVFPLVSAIQRSKYAMTALILAHGASPVFTEEHVTRALEATPIEKRRYFSSYNFSSSNNLQKIFHPIESAIAAHDDIAQLLIAIGAQVDINCKRAYGQMNARSIVDWVKFAVKALDDKIYARRLELGYLMSQKETEMDAVMVGQDPKTWKAFLAEEEARLARTKQNPKPDTKLQSVQDEITAFEEVRSYMQEIRTALIARHAKTWKEIYGDNLGIGDTVTHPVIFTPSVKQREPTRGYATLVTYGNHPVPQHQVPQYDELFEACFIGDNDKIQEICLPVKGKHKNLHPLLIQVQINNSTNIYQQSGYTPLYAAISGRQWETAKLILAITVAQYRPTATEQKFSTKGINLDNDSDEESDSGDSDITVEQAEPTFVDVAQRPSVIQNDVHPNRLLDLSNAQVSIEKEDGKYMNIYANALNKTIYENDFEAFINVLNLYKTTSLPITSNSTYAETIIQKDRADMLDEFIRRTGVGIDVKHVQKGGEEALATNDKNRLYLGLSVHGKKRVDLAKKNDPNATFTPTTHPLLWRAALAQSKGIVDYLAGDRPLAAYRFYASSSGDELALLLRRTENLEQVLPQWLGWKLTSLGESPLTAAILGKDLNLLKKLFSKNPRLMASTLHEKIKFIGYNALMVAVEIGVDPAMVDYLLAKSISPAEIDQTRGWNIYHILCRKNHCDLLAHLLTKLPRDVNEVLLAQHSKDSLDTPLHLAVKAAATRATRLIVDFTTTTLLIRNSDGSTPLHIAVQSGFSKITGLLLKADPEALYMENGVGETPLEMATLKDILERTQSFSNRRSNEEPRTITLDDISREPKPINIKNLETELPRLRSMLEQLFNDGRLIKKTKLGEELVKFADMMDVKLAKAKEVESAKPVVVVVEQEMKNPTEGRNISRTLKTLAEAVAASPGHRQLVHLIDVQKSVQRGLDRVAQTKDLAIHEDDEGLTKEEDSEVQERMESLVLQRIQVQSEIHPGGLLLGHRF